MWNCEHNNNDRSVTHTNARKLLIGWNKVNIIHFPFVLFVWSCVVTIAACVSLEFSFEMEKNNPPTYDDAVKTGEKSASVYMPQLLKSTTWKHFVKRSLTVVDYFFRHSIWTAIGKSVQHFATSKPDDAAAINATTHCPYSSPAAADLHESSGHIEPHNCRRAGSPRRWLSSLSGWEFGERVHLLWYLLGHFLFPSGHSLLPLHDPPKV